MNELIPLIFGLVVILLFACAFVGLIVSLPIVIASMIQMRSHIKPEHDEFKKLFFNKFNVIFVPGRLDQIGRKARSRLFYWLKRAALSGALAVIAFVIMGFLNYQYS